MRCSTWRRRSARLKPSGSAWNSARISRAVARPPRVEQLAQPPAHRLGARRPILPVDLEAVVHDARQLIGQLGPQLPERGGTAVAELLEQRVGAVRRVGQLLGGQVVEQGAEGEDVGAASSGSCGQLLRRHEAGGADDVGARGGGVGAERVVRRDGLDDAEVGEHQAAAVDEDVLRLEVSMDDAGVVRCNRAPASSTPTPARTDSGKVPCSRHSLPTCGPATYSITR